MKLDQKCVRLNQSERLYQIPVPIIGLTGGISTGKTTVSRLLEDKGIAVINADLLVKDIYQDEETKKFIQQKHPEVVTGDVINFKMLREKFFSDSEVKKEIETYIYQRLPQTFLSTYLQMSSPPFIVYDVPLLFEKGLDSKIDTSVLVYTPRSIQRQRLMARDGHDEEMANRILSQQLDIETKKNKADFVIDNSGRLEELTEKVDHFLSQILVFE